MNDPKAEAKALHVARSVPGDIKEVPGIGRVRFVTEYDVPWLAGSSNKINPQTGNPDVYIQRGTECVKAIDGKRYDFSLPWAVHEIKERAREKSESYTASHQYALAQENAWINKNWPKLGSGRYESACKPDISRAAKIARSGHVKIPPDLVVKPYEHPCNPLERKMYEEVFPTTNRR